MRKLIDIPDEILQELQIEAIKNKQPLKRFIEGFLYQFVIHLRERNKLGDSPKVGGKIK